MLILRKSFDGFYDLVKKPVFTLTKKDPETAHELFIGLLRFLHNTGLEKAILDFQPKPNNIKISNAAGFNKNGYIHPTSLKYLGFDRDVIGTVTGKDYEGNQKPRIKRFSHTNSLVNWMGLPGIGAESVARVISEYGNHEIPLTINIAPTPSIEDNQILSDLKKSISYTKNLPKVDRFELNVSCPNTGDEMKKYQSKLAKMLETVCNSINQGQEVYIKVSPDITYKDIDDTIKISLDFPISGFTTTNTTTEHDPNYITESLDKGGASGNAVYEKSTKIQEMFGQRLPPDKQIIACGGINSLERLKERTNNGVKEVQIYTPLIFEGPKLLRELRK